MLDLLLWGGARHIMDEIEGAEDKPLMVIKSWTCCFCDNINDVEDEKCVKCGKLGHWVCRKCSTKNRLNVEYCEKCEEGRPLSIEKELARLQISRFTPGKPWTCPNCEELNGASAVKCMTCRSPRPDLASKPQPDPSAQQSPWSCATCGRSNGGADMFCSQCGSAKPN